MQRWALLFLLLSVFDVKERLSLALLVKNSFIKINRYVSSVETTPSFELVSIERTHPSSPKLRSTRLSVNPRKIDVGSEGTTFAKVGTLEQ